MKKLRYFFSLFLTILGLGTASAQAYETGAVVTDIAAAATAGEEVLLMGSTVQGHNAGLFISPAGFNSASVLTVANVYKFVATGETIDGYPTYRLLSVQKNKYLRSEMYGSMEDTSYPGLTDGEDGNTMHAYTTDPNNAFTFTALHGDADAVEFTGELDQHGNPVQRVLDPRRAVNKNFAVDEEAWIFCENKMQPDVNTYGYFGTYGTGFMSIYTDTNQWVVYKAHKLSGAANLLSYINTLLNDSAPSDLFEAGTNPGQVDINALDDLTDAYNGALEVANNENSTQDACDAAKAALDEAYAAVVNSMVKLQPGRVYLFQSPGRSAGATMYEKESDSKLYWEALSAVPTSDNVTADQAKFFFSVEAASDTTYYLKNMLTGHYVAGAAAQAASNQFGTSTEAAVPFEIVRNYTQGQKAGFNIRWQAWNSNYNTFHWDGGNKIVTWVYDAGASVCVVADVTDAATAVAEQVENQKKLSALTTSYLKASELFNRGRAFISAEAAADTLIGYTTALGLVTDAAKLSTNAAETAEHTTKRPTQGDVANLVDGSDVLFFHSRWRSAADDPNTYHYVQADLGAAIQTFAIKYAKRFNNLDVYNPTEILVTATNDPDGVWNYAGVYPLTYTDSAWVHVTDSTEAKVVKQNYIGTRGIELPEAYRYVRIAVTKTQYNTGLLNGFPYFYLSELHFHPAQYDAAHSTVGNMDATIVGNLQTALNNAAAELTSGQPTQATIDALNAAYAAFLEIFPDPNTLQTVVNEAKALKAAAPVGEELGFYPQAAVDAFNNVITEVEATIEDGMTLETINAGKAAIANAVAAFKASFILPEVGKVYVIRSAAEGRTRNLVYSTGNSETAALQSTAQVEGVDPVVIGEDLNYLWKVAAKDGFKLTLQNLGTGYYLGGQDEKNGAVPNVATPTALPVQSAGIGGIFNIIVGEGEYLNLAGGDTRMCAWNAASGADNSAFSFEEVNMGTAYLLQSRWPVTADKFQILTLPYGSAGIAEDEAAVYEVLGVNEVNDSCVVELKALSSTDDLVAGMPYIIKPGANVTAITTMPLDDDPLNLTYATAGQTSANGALTGTISEMTLEENGKIIFTYYGPALIGINSPASLRAIGANSGYINNVPTTETGDIQIKVKGTFTDGIGNITIVDGNAKDIYTISGVKVNGKNLPAGVYIIGGQKKVVK